MTDDEETVAREAIEKQVRQVTKRILCCAQHMAAKLNASVYLVGSVLHNPAPRDVDFRLVVSDHEFGRRFGMEMKPTEKKGYTSCIAWDDDGPTQRWIDDCAKTGAEWSAILGHNVDYKVWPASYWRVPYPTPILVAAPSPRWAIYNEYFPDPSAARAGEPATRTEDGR